MNGLLTERSRNIVAGAVGLLLLISAIAIGIKASFGAFDGGYELRGTFAAAGQGLLEGSDVKVRGVNIGEVAGIELVDNRALITLRINDGTRVPVGAQAVIRPKTLFGEKFVDLLPGETELTGPYLEGGDEILDTLGGFELERVLSDAFPVLEAIDPAELAIVLDELATAGDGLGEQINRSILNGARLAELQVSNDAELRQFLGDLALLSEELDRLAPALVRGARDFNVALPTLNARSDKLNDALVQLGRISGDVADLLDNNRGFTEAALRDGSKTLQVLFDERGQLQPVLLGVTQYTQTIGEAIRIEVGDGSLMAAVKNLVHVPGPLVSGASAGSASPGPEAPTEPGLLDDITGLVDDAVGTSEDLLGLLAGGGR